MRHFQSRNRQMLRHPSQSLQEHSWPPPPSLHHDLLPHTWLHNPLSDSHSLPQAIHAILHDVGVDDYLISACRPMRLCLPGFPSGLIDDGRVLSISHPHLLDCIHQMRTLESERFAGHSIESETYVDIYQSLPVDKYSVSLPTTLQRVTRYGWGQKVSKIDCLLPVFYKYFELLIL